MLENTFSAMLNMSITASVAVVLILFFRWIFGTRLPKIFSYVLWAIVLLRLLMPFSLPSGFSIYNVIPEPRTIMTQSPVDHGTDNNSPYETGYGSISQEKSFAETPEASVDPMQVLTFFISWIWFAGAAGIFSFSIFTYFRTSRRLKEAVLYRHNDLMSQCNQKLKLNRELQIYTSDRIHTPVVCGLIKARIILPLHLTQECSELELRHIITHEMVHIKRFDYLFKPLAVTALCVHWFNPVIWAAFILSQKDMEMSCDEKVMSVFDNDIRSEYAASLIKLAVRQNGLINGGLLAFGESHIKSRIKGIMNFRKPGFWLGTMTFVILIAIGLLLLTNGQSTAGKEDENGVNSEQITGFAREIINRDIANYESNPEVNIIDSKITRLELVETFDALADTPINVYALEFRLLPKDLNKVVLAGGMQVDEDGWIKETSSMGSPLLVISSKNDAIKLIGTLWTGGVLEDGGLETSIKALLKQNSGTNEIATLVEENLTVIMSSPKESSNPQDYIDAHQQEYEIILKFGGEDALSYMLSQFEAGTANGLRGQLMMRLSKHFLGVRNNVTGDSLAPNEWYRALSIRQEIKLPDFVYDGSDPIETLVYSTEIAEKTTQRGFTVIAPKIFGTYEEDGLLKVFVTTYTETYRLYGDVLENVGGSVGPAAII